MKSQQHQIQIRAAIRQSYPAPQVPNHCSTGAITRNPRRLVDASIHCSFLPLTERTPFNFPKTAWPLPGSHSRHFLIDNPFHGLCKSLNRPCGLQLWCLHQKPHGNPSRYVPSPENKKRRDNHVPADLVSLSFDASAKARCQSAVNRAVGLQHMLLLHCHCANERCVAWWLTSPQSSRQPQLHKRGPEQMGIGEALLIISAS